MRAVVTGAAGFIGANLVRGLNRLGIDDVIAVDDLTDGSKYKNLLGCAISDYFDKTEFYERLSNRAFGKVDIILHQGACSDTMEHDGRFMLENNYRCSKHLLDSCSQQGIRLLYASSAATYGDSETFLENPDFEKPRNVYGYSKLLFDNVVRLAVPALTTQVAGFRYFNVYGPHENHKGRMASVAFHHHNQIRERGYVTLFGAYDGYEAGEQSRDFVFVDDVVAVNMWFLENPQCSGIFNLGTGAALTFNKLAGATVNAHRRRSSLPEISLQQMIEQGLVRYLDFPEELKGKYQSFTRADLTNLRQVGCNHQFMDLDKAVELYSDWLQNTGSY
jgi:ADP-L-glycero-D-manno-heptose 6-epimerase